MHAHKLKVTIAEDHRLALNLPVDFPSGPAEVTIRAVPPGNRRIVRAGGVLSPGRAVPPGDPIGEALDELREERSKRLERPDNRALIAGAREDGAQREA